MRQADGGKGRGALVAPALFLVVFWWLVPAVATLVVAAVDGGLTAALDNLRFLVSGGAAREAIRNTVVWVVGIGVGATVLGLALAWLADRLKAGHLFTAVLLVPTVLAPAAVAVIWRSTLAFRPAGTDQVGLLNAVMSTAGLNPVAWLTQVPLNTVLLAGALVWTQTAVAMLILSAAISRVPSEVRDAARVDGASETQIFGRITVPTIKGAVLLSGLTAMVVAVRAFDLVKVATDGQFGTSVLATEMFDQAFILDQAGRGATLALLMTALVLPAALVVLRRVRRPEVAA